MELVNEMDVNQLESIGIHASTTSSPSLPQPRSSSSGFLGEPFPSGIPAAGHVYAADVGVSLMNETVDALHYDDATQLLMVIKGGVIFAYDLAMDAPGHHEQLVWTYPLQEGPRVTSLRCSLDQQMLGCMRWVIPDNQWCP